MLIICLALSACKVAQLPYTHDSRACVVREARDKFAPDASAKAATLSVRRDRKLEGRVRHAMCGWEGKVAQVWHVCYIHGHPARAAHAVEFLRRRATAAWSGGATAEHSVRDKNEANGEMCIEVIAQLMAVILLASHRGISKVPFIQVVGPGINDCDLSPST